MNHLFVSAVSRSNQTTNFARKAKVSNSMRKDANYFANSMQNRTNPLENLSYLPSHINIYVPNREAYLDNLDADEIKTNGLINANQFCNENDKQTTFKQCRNRKSSTPNPKKVKKNISKVNENKSNDNDVEEFQISWGDQVYTVTSPEEPILNKTNSQDITEPPPKVKPRFSLYKKKTEDNLC